MFDKAKQLLELKRMQSRLASQEVVIEENGVRVVISGDQRIKELTVQGVGNQVLIDVLNKALKKSQEAVARSFRDMSGDLSGLLDNLR